MYCAFCLQGYTAPTDSVPNTEPNSITSTADQPDSIRCNSKQQQQHHVSSTNKHHHSNNNSLNNNNNNHSASTNINLNNNNNLNHNNNTTINNNTSKSNHARGTNNTSSSANTMSSKVTSKSSGGASLNHYATTQQHSANHIASHGNSTSANPLSTGPMSMQYETSGGSSALRKSPEGKDNDSFRIEDNKLSRDQQKYQDNNKLLEQQKYRENNAINAGGHPKIGNDISTEIFSASNDNGKINVQVTVLVGEFEFDFCSFVFVFCFFICVFIFCLDCFLLRVLFSHFGCTRWTFIWTSNFKICHILLRCSSKIKRIVEQLLFRLHNQKFVWISLNRASIERIIELQKSKVSSLCTYIYYFMICSVVFHSQWKIPFLIIFFWVSIFFISFLYFQIYSKKNVSANYNFVCF